MMRSSSTRLLSLARILLLVAAVACSQLTNATEVAIVYSAPELSSALRNYSVSLVMVAADVDMDPEIPVWRAGDSFLLNRSLTISAHPATPFPRINWRLWPKDTSGITYVWWLVSCSVRCTTVGWSRATYTLIRIHELHINKKSQSQP
jgi:hypothetical protein